MSTEKRPRKPRRNYARDWERLELYVATVIRIKEKDDQNDLLDQQLRAYRDVLEFMGGK